MAWSGTVTSRGDDAQSGGALSLSTAAFTPSAGSLLLAVVYHSSNSGESISGHGTWSRIYDPTPVAIRDLEVWACIVGSSPSSAAVTMSGSYTWTCKIGVVEITGLDTTGAVADVFGVNSYDEFYDTDEAVFTLGSFQDAESITCLAIGNSDDMTMPTSPSGWADHGTTWSSTGNSVYCDFGYYNGEDNDPDISGMGGWTDYGAIAFELKGEAAGGGGGGSARPKRKAFGNIRGGMGALLQLRGIEVVKPAEVVYARRRARVFIDPLPAP